MQVKIAKCEIIIHKDFQNDCLTIEVNQDGFEQDVIAGLAHAMVTNPDIRRIFNSAGRKANEERAKNSN